MNGPFRAPHCWGRESDGKPCGNLPMDQGRRTTIVTKLLCEHMRDCLSGGQSVHLPSLTDRGSTNLQHEYAKGEDVAVAADMASIGHLGCNVPACARTSHVDRHLLPSGDAIQRSRELNNIMKASTPAPFVNESQRETHPSVPSGLWVVACAPSLAIRAGNSLEMPKSPSAATSSPVTGSRRSSTLSGFTSR